MTEQFNASLVIKYGDRTMGREAIMIDKANMAAALRRWADKFDEWATEVQTETEIEKGPVCGDSPGPRFTTD